MSLVSQMSATSTWSRRGWNALEEDVAEVLERKRRRRHLVIGQLPSRLRAREESMATGFSFRLFAGKRRRNEQLVLVVVVIAVDSPNSLNLSLRQALLRLAVLADDSLGTETRRGGGVRWWRHRARGVRRTSTSWGPRGRRQRPCLDQKSARDNERVEGGTYTIETVALPQHLVVYDLERLRVQPAVLERLVLPERPRLQVRHITRWRPHQLHPQNQLPIHKLSRRRKKSTHDAIEILRRLLRGLEPLRPTRRASGPVHATLPPPAIELGREELEDLDAPVHAPPREIGDGVVVPEGPTAVERVGRVARVGREGCEGAEEAVVREGWVDDPAGEASVADSEDALVPGVCAGAELVSWGRVRGEEGTDQVARPRCGQWSS